MPSSCPPPVWFRVKTGQLLELPTLIGLAAFGQSLGLIPKMREFHSLTQGASFAIWFQIILVPSIAGAIGAGSGMLLLRGDLRAIAGIAGGVGVFTLIALCNAWILFIWMLEQHHHPR